MFLDIDTFLKRDKFADAVINGTMDELHVKTSIPILRKGYDMLLEKPFCTNEREMRELEEVARETGRKVMICHVLRYTPFYSSIKRHVLDGEIGILSAWNLVNMSRIIISECHTYVGNGQMRVNAVRQFYWQNSI